MENIKEISEELTDEEMKQLKEAEKKRVVFDEECQETLPKEQSDSSV